MTAQTWDSIKQSAAVALTQQTNLDATTFSATFEIQFPQATSYAENRIYREIPMMGQEQTQTFNSATSSGNRTVDFSSVIPNLLVVDQFFLQASGVNVPYDRVSYDFLMRIWPVQEMTVTPSLTWQGGRYFAPVTETSLAIAPTPDAVYTALMIGPVQPTPISNSNQSTYLSTVYPELLEAGCMVFLTGALTRNFGAQADETGQAMSWEAQFLKLLDAARLQELRRRGLAPDYPMMRAPAAPAGG